MAGNTRATTADAPTTTTPPTTGETLSHGDVVEVSRPNGGSQMAVIDSRNYRGVALTVPGETRIVYVSELNDSATVTPTGYGDSRYSHPAVWG